MAFALHTAPHCMIARIQGLQPGLPKPHINLRQYFHPIFFYNFEVPIRSWLLYDSYQPERMKVIKFFF